MGVASSRSSGWVGGGETWNLCGCLQQPSFLWHILQGPLVPLGSLDLLLVAGAVPPSFPHQILTGFRSWSPVVSIECHLVCACHEVTLWSHDLKYLGDSILVTFDASGSQSFANAKNVHNFTSLMQGYSSHLPVNLWSQHFDSSTLTMSKFGAN